MLRQSVWEQRQKEARGARTVGVDFALDLPIGAARDAQTDGAAGAVTRQTNHAHVVAKVLAAWEGEEGKRGRIKRPDQNR